MSLLVSEHIIKARHLTSVFTHFMLNAVLLPIPVPIPLCPNFGGTAAAVPPLFSRSEPALCGSCPLVTPYYCRLGTCCVSLCNGYLYTLVCVCVCVFSVFFMFVLISFVDSPSVLWYCWLGLLTCKNRLPYNLYCVGGDVKHCSLTYVPIYPTFSWDCCVSNAGSQ